MRGFGLLLLILMALAMVFVSKSFALSVRKPATLISINQVQLIRLSLQYWNKKIPGLNLHLRDGINPRGVEMQAAINREFLLMQFWYEGAVQTMPHEFQYLEARPSNENLRTLVCTGLSCGGGSSGSACGPAC